MDLKTMGGMIAGLVVAIVMVTMVLIPVADTDNYRTYANNTVGYTGTIADSSEDIDLTIEIDSSHAVTINGIAYTYSVNDVLAFTESSQLLCTTLSPFISFNYELNGVKTANANLAAVTFTASEGELTAVITKQDTTTQTITLDYDWICYRDNSGNDRIFNLITSSKDVYYSENAPIYAIGPAGTAGYAAFVNDRVVTAGTEYDGTLDGTQYRNSVYQATLTYQSGSDLYVVEGDNTYYPFYAAVSGSIDTSSEMDDQAFDLISIIPLLMVVAIILGIVAMFITRRS